METDGEGKLFSFKVILGGTPLFKMNHGAVSIAWSVVLIGALQYLRDSSWWIQGHMSEEKSLKKFFFFYSFCGHFENVDLDREGAGGPTIS